MCWLILFPGCPILLTSVWYFCTFIQCIPIITLCLVRVSSNMAYILTLYSIGYFLIMISFSIFRQLSKYSSFECFLKILWKMEHLLQKSKCFIFHNIFKYMIFQRCQRHFFSLLFVILKLLDLGHEHVYAVFLILSCVMMGLLCMWRGSTWLRNNPGVIAVCMAVCDMVGLIWATVFIDFFCTYLYFVVNLLL